jgi:hypothetical protein
MSSTRIDELIIKFNENNYDNIDSMVNDLNCIIMEAANMSLKLKSPRKTRNSKILNKKKDNPSGLIHLFSIYEDG